MTVAYNAASGGVHGKRQRSAKSRTATKVSTWEETEGDLGTCGIVVTEPASIRAARLRRDGEDLEIPHVPLFRSEAEFTTAVITLARSCGWLVHHDRPAVVRSGKWATHVQGDTGFPDIYARHPDGREVVAELKMAPASQIKGRPSETQWRWLDAFAAADSGRAIVRVWRPEDYDREIVPTFAGAWEVRNG